jgi:hypothetical protein
MRSGSPSGIAQKQILRAVRRFYKKLDRSKRLGGDPAVPKGAAGGRQGRNVITMLNREIGASQALRRRMTNLDKRMRDARITENELKTFRKVAAVMEDGKGRIDADDLIAASFVVETLD